MTALHDWRTSLSKGDVIYVIRTRYGGPRHLLGKQMVCRHHFLGYMTRRYVWIRGGPKKAGPYSIHALYPSRRSAIEELNRRQR